MHLVSFEIQSLEINKLEKPNEHSLLPGEAIGDEHLLAFLLLAGNSTEESWWESKIHPFSFYQAFRKNNFSPAEEIT